MDIQNCRLCGLYSTIKNSHIIPALVARKLKKDSITGFLRSTKTPNKREEDTDKHPLLCKACEQRFSNSEDKFNRIFLKFRDLNEIDFAYGEWLHYFITSVTWRTLVMDIEKPDNIPPQILAELKVAESTMRKYLLGENPLGDSIDNHAFFFVPNSESKSQALLSLIPIIRMGAGGYALWIDGFSAVRLNLAGFLCVTHIQRNLNDVWINTRVLPNGGKFKHPQKIESWILNDLLEHTRETLESGNNLSEKQREIIENAIREKTS